MTKQSTASAAVAASAAERDRACEAVADPAVGGHVQQRLQRQPLRGEAVQRRQPGDRHRTDEKRAAGPRHPPKQTAQPVELERSDAALERAGPEKQQRLEHGVVERVQQRRRERERRPVFGAARTQEQAGAETEHDDPDVLDRVEREQTLQVVLEERVDDTADRRERTDGEDEHAEPERQHAEPVDEHAHEPVDRDLDHHAAHQRRHRRRRDRVRPRQPAVQRHQPRLRAHADERRKRDPDLEARTLRDGSAADRARVRREQDGDPGAGAGEMRDRDVDEHGVPRAPVRASDEDHRCREQRHQLPAREKGQRVACAQHLDENEQERARQDADRPPLRRRLEVPRREHEHRRGDEAEHAEEERRQPVDAEAEHERARERRADSRTGRERPEPEHAEHARSDRLRPEARTECRARSRADGTDTDQRGRSNQNAGRHSASSSCNRDCSPASRRVMISRPAASRSNTRSSSTL